jgi:hypothetical protein
MAVVPCAINAQQTIYNYDPLGNLTDVSLSGSAAPSITIEPQPQLIENDGLVTLSVVANGGGLTYQWLSNGAAIVGATGDSLVLSNLPVVNSTNFSVVISNASGSVTSAPVALWADSNGNGIPDWWELKYFGNLNQTGNGDYDGDGVDNLDEYLEGTDPTNPNSYDPRLYLTGIGGRVIASPDLPYYKMGQFVTLTGIPDNPQDAVTWSGSVTGNKPVIAVLMDGHQTITATFSIPLSVALDNTNLVWTTGGNVPWFGETAVSYDGVSAAQNGPIDNNQESWLQTITTNTTESSELSFWWSVSSQPPDGLTFSVDGTGVASISGEAVGWEQFNTNLLAGDHTLLWTYAKGGGNNPTGIPFSDAGWVDEVTLVPIITQADAPYLCIALTSTNTVLISWSVPPAIFRLQQNSGLNSTNWVSVTNRVNVVDGQNQVTILPTGSTQFYRLQYP